MGFFPHNSKYEDMKKWNPDAYFISNGPGDPEPLSNAINVTKEILNSYSFFWYMFRSSSYSSSKWNKDI